MPLNPLVGAIAAGNCAIVKPSEISENTSYLLCKLIPKYLDPKAFKFVYGAIPETTELLNQHFDQITYTGHGAVGQLVLAAAAKHLTPVLLELGGKSPVYIDREADLKNAAKRVMWAKISNAGQTCIAPDYILCHRDVVDDFCKGLAVATREMLGDNPKASPEYSRIISDNHYNRLSSMLAKQLENKDSLLVTGGLDTADPKDRFIPPTVVRVTKDSTTNPLLQSEIFGPLLPIFSVSSVDEAIEYINERDHPLALYSFSRNSKTNNYVFDNTQSGGVMANDLFMNMNLLELPFGGVGPSGMGNYHGKHSYDAYSHHRSVLIRPSGMEILNEARYPPFNASKTKLLDMIGPKVKMNDPNIIQKLGKLVATNINLILVLAVVVGSFFIGRATV